MDSSEALAGRDYTEATGSPPGFIPVTDPERIPTRRYYDEAFYKLECERLWPRVWQMACRLEEIPEVGDFVVYEILEQSVVLVRAKDGGVKAFHNACRHRGVKLAEGEGNCEVRGFQCPFHGWRWNMDGQNTFVYQPHLFSERAMDPEDLNLVPCRVETWGGCAFINFDNDAAPLRDCIEPFATTHDARHAEKMRVEWWTSTVLPANWKLAIEAFMEAYHVLRTHPQLVPRSVRNDNDAYGKPVAGATSSQAQRMAAFRSPRELVDGYIAFMRELSVGMGGMIHARDVAVAETLRDIELPDDMEAARKEWHLRLNEAIVAEGKRTGRDMPDLVEIDRTGPWGSVNFCFPNYFLLPYYGNMASYRIRPLGPETCLFELWSLTLCPEGEVRPKPVAPAPVPHDSQDFPPVPRQDYSNIPAQQLGLHARGFEFMRLSRDIEGLISNFQRMIDGYLTDVPKEKLVAALPKVNTAIDVPIDDLGF
jgi:phenylpropionate dioxygenase-like ring-hydroxylating dioxygenase large terminal subunit